MNIGIDIDNVISNFDESFGLACLEYDKAKLRGSGVVNFRAQTMFETFDWSEDELIEFLSKHCEDIAKNLDIKWNCKKYIDKLLEDGHNVYLITHRAAPCYNSPRKTTRDWLKKFDVKYTKLIFSQDADKTKECLNNNIDVMIDDRLDQCRIMSANGIRCFVMLTKYNYLHVKGFPYVYTWEDVYKTIKNIEDEREASL